MKLLKYGIVGIGTLMLVLSAMSVSAETINDGTNDVYHITWVSTAWTATVSTDAKPNIDITQLTSSFENKNLTLTLTVAGTIQNSSKIVYFILYNTSDTMLMVTYNSELKMAAGFSTSNPFQPIIGEVVLSADEKSFIATIPLNTTTEPTALNFTGWAWEYPVNFTSADQGYQGEWWGDWAPDTQFPYEVTNPVPVSPTPQPKTPGFETVLAIAAVGAALIILKRRK